MLFVDLAELPGRHPADAVDLGQVGAVGPALFLEVERDQEGAAGRHHVPAAEDGAARGEGAQEKHRARDAVDLFGDFVDEQRGGVAEGRGRRTA